MNSASSEHLIVREEEPLNLEMPFSTLNGFITPNESFYVRCHFPIPEIAPEDWRLKVEGEVEAPFELTYDELRGIESRTIAATLECAGNNRLFLKPKVKGVQWGLGAVGNASWTGVPLSALLERAKIKANAVEVILEGADEGEVDKTPKPAGKISFCRSLPLSKAQSDVLLAHEMNGEKLSATHGFPLRAIVPGWYAMASVKWLRRIIVTDKPFNGFYQSLDYTYWDRSGALPSLAPLAEQQVKAEIARPESGEVVAADSAYRVHGAAWSGESDIAKVEISFDDGASWQEAKLPGEPVKNTWRLWEYEWRTPVKPGRYTLLARATDSRGRTQSRERSADRGTYMINHLLPVDVEAR
ncbi:MAG TPA: sulfite oxidase [Chthoniobacterales bacterium]|jgi:DMSO/TMAO reductase YedYZ molybdopterin-dependent catalytic subunit